MRVWRRGVNGDRLKISNRFKLMYFRAQRNNNSFTKVSSSLRINAADDSDRNLGSRPAVDPRWLVLAALTKRLPDRKLFHSNFFLTA